MLHDNPPGSATAPAFDWERLSRILDEALERERTKLGKINIIVAGRTGTGKSTLINAIFGQNFASTAMGRPVTQHAAWYERENHPLRILDTKGLETSEYETTWTALENEIAKGRSSADPRQQIHIGWVCVQEPGLRFEDAEQKLVEALKRQGIPVVIVLTKHGMFPEFREEVAKLAPMADSVVQVRALPMPNLSDTAGLEDLVQATFRLLPEAVRSAFVSAQTIDYGLKTVDARKIIVATTTAAAAAAAIPLPFSDAITLVPIQVGMIVGISFRFGIGGATDKLVPLASSIVGCLAATATGRIIVGQLLKLLPGGSLVNATVAAGLTTALGEAYLAFLLMFQRDKGRLPSVEEIASGFGEFWKGWDRKGDKPSGALMLR